jgi:hypothetical protein
MHTLLRIGSHEIAGVIHSFGDGMGLLKNHRTCVEVSFPKEGWHFQPRDLVFRHIRMTGVLVERNRLLKAMLKFAAENGVRATIKTFALEDLNKLGEVYHQRNFGKLVVDMEKSPGKWNIYSQSHSRRTRGICLDSLLFSRFCFLFIDLSRAFLPMFSRRSVSASFLISLGFK